MQIIRKLPIRSKARRSLMELTCCKFELSRMKFAGSKLKFYTVVSIDFKHFKLRLISLSDITFVLQ